MKLHLITVATHEQGYFENLKQTCETHGVDLVVLGWGQPWKGFTYKINLVQDYSKTLSPDDVVMFIDAFDTIVLRPQNEIVEEFLRFEKDFSGKIWMSFEQTHPDPLFRHFKNEIFSNVNLNSGTYIGRVVHLQKLWERTLQVSQEIHSKDDQTCLSYIYENDADRGNMVLDETHTLAHVLLAKSSLVPFLPSQKTFTVQEGKLRVHQSFPIILHAPGNMNMNSILKRLGIAPSRNGLQTTMQYLKYCTLTSWLLKKNK